MGFFNRKEIVAPQDNGQQAMSRLSPEQLAQVLATARQAEERGRTAIDRINQEIKRAKDEEEELKDKLHALTLKYLPTLKQETLNDPTPKMRELQEEIMKVREQLNKLEEAIMQNRSEIKKLREENGVLEEAA